MAADQQLHLPAQATSPQQAREFVVRILREWGVGHLADPARLLTSELVTNAVLHARTSLVVSVDRDDQRKLIRITVADHNPARPRRRKYSELSTAGRGLAMVAMAAQDHGVVSQKHGKAVWFALPISPDADAGAPDKSTTT